MRRESNAERAAWTAAIEGQQLSRNKYGNERVEAGGRKFDSKHEANEAVKLEALASRGIIQDLRYQVPFTLVEGRGRILPIKYIADFVFTEGGKQRIVDAKGCKTPVYRLKRKLAMLLHGIEIEEV